MHRTPLSAMIALLSVSGRLPTRRTIYIGRVTSQVAEKHRVSVNREAQRRCDGATLKVDSDGCRNREVGWLPACLWRPVERPRPKPPTIISRCLIRSCRDAGRTR